MTETVLDPNHCLIRCSSIRFDTVISTVLQLAEAYLHWTMQSLVINAALTQLFAEIITELRENKDTEFKDQESLDSAALQWVEDLVEFLQTGRKLFVHSIHKLQGLEDRVAAVIQDFEFDNRRLRVGENTEADNKDEVLLLESQGDTARGDRSKSHSLDETAELLLSGKLQEVAQSVHIFFAKRTVNHQVNDGENVESEEVPDFIALAQQQYDAWGNGFTKCLVDFVHALHVTEILVREPNVVQTVTTCIKMAVEMAARLLDKVNWKAFWVAREVLTSNLGKKKVANLVSHAEKLMFAPLYDKNEGQGGGKSRVGSVVSLAIFFRPLIHYGVPVFPCPCRRPPCPLPPDRMGCSWCPRRCRSLVRSPYHPHGVLSLYRSAAQGGCPGRDAVSVWSVPVGSTRRPGWPLVLNRIGVWPCAASRPSPGGRRCWSPMALSHGNRTQYCGHSC